MKIAVSACLLGEKIRFDGGHKESRFITQELSNFAQFIPFCPEHIAFGTPRGSIRLVQIEGSICVRTNKDDQDVTTTLTDACHHELQKLENEELSGIIFKSKSPSCGMKSSKLYHENGYCEGKEDGLFMAMCRKQYPLLPMEEEGRLEDPWLRENFVMQIFAYQRFETLKKSSPTLHDLIHFHTVHKFMLQAKDEKIYRELGNIVSNREKIDFNELLKQYELGFKTAIGKKSSIKRNVNVLEHMAGFFKKELTKSEKTMLHEHIQDYADKIIPLIVPLSTISLYAHKYETRYLLDQMFLEPYPKILSLRSHISAGK